MRVSYECMLVEFRSPNHLDSHFYPPPSFPPHCYSPILSLNLSLLLTKKRDMCLYREDLEVWSEWRFDVSLAAPRWLIDFWVMHHAACLDCPTKWEVMCRADGIDKISQQGGILASDCHKHRCTWPLGPAVQCAGLSLCYLCPNKCSVESKTDLRTPVLPLVCFQTSQSLCFPLSEAAIKFLPIKHQQQACSSTFPHSFLGVCVFFLISLDSSFFV